MIKTIKIHPSIGVARLGNSQNGYFIGPEIPGDATIPAGGYREAGVDSPIKRQAARFHLFAYDENGALVQEITSNDANIQWTVHLANTKAAAELFHGKNTPPPGMRNQNFADRNQLSLDPGPATVGGKNPDFADLQKSRTTGAAKELQVNQLFLDQQVQLSLGTVTTDDRGLLLVMGGYGVSNSPVGADLTQGDFADHDGWYDDISDGPISASVTLKDGSTPPVLSAWVLVAPPKFAPGLQSVVTLYDTLFQAAIDRGLLPDPFSDPNFQPSLANDIQPILMRAANMRWVFDNGRPQFKPSAFHHTFNNMPPAARMTVFNMLSVPPATPGDPAAGGGSMPKMWSDLYPDGANGTLTKTQYQMIRMWKDGRFIPGTPPAPAITPDGLTRAALDTCVGAPFFPGIEASWKIRDVFPYVEAFRLDAANMHPGDVSSQMSLPWQSDFLDCFLESGKAGIKLVWWPAQRPIAVLKPGGDAYFRWARVADADPTELTVDQMITDWFKLAFVIQQPDGRYEEQPRQ